MRSLGRHARFLAAILLGLAVFAATLLAGVVAERAAIIALDALFLAYLILSLPLFRLTTEQLRARAASADAGTALILIFAALALAGALLAIFVTLNRDGGDLTETVLALAALPLGWATLHSLAAFHYAHLYYAQEQGKDRGGLIFPGDDTPLPSDFIYFSFGIAMTAQVSDVVVASPAMRRAVTVHAVASFATNTVILALAVNAAAG